jgi:muconolactone D-isomerase
VIVHASPFEATAARLGALIADVTVVPVEGGPHNLGWTHAREADGALLGFLAGAPADIGRLTSGASSNRSDHEYLAALSDEEHTASTVKEKPMEFLVEFDVNVPDGAAASEVEARYGAEASAAAKLVEEGHLVRLWRPPARPGETKALGLYRADSPAQLAGLLGALPLYDWMHITLTPLEPHPNDPAPQTTVSGDARSRP